MRDLGKAHFFLGIELTPNSSRCPLSQSKYISTIHKQNNLENNKPVSNSYSFSTTKITPQEPIDPLIYQSTVGALQYLTIIRLNISFVVNRICQAMHNLLQEDWACVKHLLRYLKGTILEGFQFHKLFVFFISIFSVADWVGSPIDQRSSRGYLVYLEKNLISQSSRKQPTITQSSIESEYKVAANAAAKLIWIVPFEGTSALSIDHFGTMV